MPRNQDRQLGQDHPQQEDYGDIPFSIAQRKLLPSSGQSTSKNTTSACRSLLAATPHHGLKVHGPACGQAGDSMAPFTCLQAACSPPLSGSWPGTSSLLEVHQWVSVPILHCSKSGVKLALKGGPALCWAFLEDRALKADTSHCRSQVTWSHCKITSTPRYGEATHSN